MVSIGISFARKFTRRDGSPNEGETLLLVLFAPVFLMYALLSWHLRGEPNWPAVSYLSLLVVLASHWRKMLLARKKSQPFIIMAFGLAWLQTLLMHDSPLLHLPQKLDPMGRVLGWREIAAHLEEVSHSQHTDVFIADAYKEAGVFSYYLPDQRFVYTLRHSPPANQYDLWPGYPTNQRALWITGERTPVALQRDFNSITWLEHDIVFFHDKPFREYDVYLCENKAQPPP
jgi:hypothetical protein